MGRSLALGVALAALLAACSSPSTSVPPTEVTTMESMTPRGGADLVLSSDAFREGGAIPRRHTCQGEDLSPPLAWSGTPDGTAALAIIVDDPDARGWVHWVAYDIPADGGRLAEGASGGGPFREGETTWGTVGWRGPCPPSGTHRYVFSLLALDEPLGDAGPLTAEELRSRARGHVLAEARLTGTYRKG
jgi:Raf kinase inhibitor-like YbhB/YbcL family protein